MREHLSNVPIEKRTKCRGNRGKGCADGDELNRSRAYILWNLPFAFSYKKIDL